MAYWRRDEIAYVWGMEAEPKVTLDDEQRAEMEDLADRLIREKAAKCELLKGRIRVEITNSFRTLSVSDAAEVCIADYESERAAVGGAIRACALAREKRLRAEEEANEQEA